MIKKILNSPSLMTIGNLSAKSSSLIILLPIVLTTFPKEDIVVWYIYFTIASLQMLIDFGFLPTFSRFFSYANAGLDIKKIQNIKDVKSESVNCNYKSVMYLFSATKKIYMKLALFSFFIAVFFGTLLVYEPLSKSSNFLEASLGWAFVITLASFNLYANIYVSLLTGLDKVALIQKWQMITSFLAVITSSFVIHIYSSLLFGIVTFYLWTIVNIIINIYLSRNIRNKLKYQIDNDIEKKLIKNTIWPTAWKSGLGVFMSMGLIQISGLVVSKLENSNISASYLIGLQIIRAISSFTQAPFYSRLPYFSKLYAQKDIQLLIVESKKRMQTSLFIFVLMFVIIGLFSDILLKLIGSNAQFPDSTSWILLSLSFFLERYGAMYLQLYTLTNHIIWHYVNGYTGLFMIILSALLYKKLGIYALLISMVLSYSIIYVPIVIIRTYREFNLNFINHEKSNFILFLFLFSICSLLINLNLIKG